MAMGTQTHEKPPFAGQGASNAMARRIVHDTHPNFELSKPVLDRRRGSNKAEFQQ
jgi:hypothetical protein